MAGPIPSNPGRSHFDKPKVQASTPSHSRAVQEHGLARGFKYRRGGGAPRPPLVHRTDTVARASISGHLRETTKPSQGHAPTPSAVPAPSCPPPGCFPGMLPPQAFCPPRRLPDGQEHLPVLFPPFPPAQYPQPPPPQAPFQYFPMPGRRTPFSKAPPPYLVPNSSQPLPPTLLFPLQPPPFLGPPPSWPQGMPPLVAPQPRLPVPFPSMPALPPGSQEHRDAASRPGYSGEASCPSRTDGKPRDGYVAAPTGTTFVSGSSNPADEGPGTVPTGRPHVVAPPPAPSAPPMASPGGFPVFCGPHVDRLTEENA